jgi:hypothetical protein
MFTCKAVALPPMKRAMRGRRLVIVDIENVVGGAVLSQEAALWAKAQVREVIAVTASDQIVIGTSHIGLLPTGCAWPKLRFVVASGPDGADRALLEVLEENVAGRFGEVVLVSGDGIFTEAVSGLTRRGVRVAVVAHKDGLSNRLRMAATHVAYLPTRYDAALPLCGVA